MASKAKMASNKRKRNGRETPSRMARQRKRNNAKKENE